MTRSKKYLYIVCRCRNCFGKSWLKDSWIEMERILYNKNHIKMLYEINKTTKTVILQLRIQKP